MWWISEKGLRMKATTKLLHTQGTLYTFSDNAPLESWVEAFLIDRKVQNVSEGTLSFYRKKLKVFIGFCEAQVITNINDITPTTLRQFLLYLEDTGHNPGGIHAFYRSLRAFLNWWEIEAEPVMWKNPVKKVKPPRVPIEPLDPVNLSDISKLVESCENDTFTGKRDQAIILCLLDTGTRAQEFLDICLEDINPIKGDIVIRKGKGRKPRFVYLGRKSRRAVRTYLRYRSDESPWLWVRKDGIGYFTKFGKC
jgi:integrase/recombinase XerD